MQNEPMRTTINLDDDVAAALARVRKEQDLTLSEAVNVVVRAGLANSPAPTPFHQRTAPLGLRIDVSNIGEVLEILDGTSPGFP